MIVIHILLWIMAAIADAIMDKVTFHYDESVFKKLNKNFWDINVSWKNKYKGGIKENGPKFWGSTTFFVMFTDAFHLFQGLMNFCIIGVIITGLLLVPHIEFSMWKVILLFAGYKFVYGVIFELFFRKIFNNKL